ncbi:MAG: hypothetical protein U0Q18_32270 [Bryobacteraceae bacterium]
MRGLYVLLLAVGLTAQTHSTDLDTIADGVPLRVALEKRVRIRRIGQEVRGRLIEPVYVFDRMALPAGTSVEGHISDIGKVSFGRRLVAALSGNFAPPRQVRAQFDSILLPGGSRLPVSTSPSNGTPHLIRAAKRTKSQAAGTLQIDGMDPIASLTYKAPGKMNLMKTRLYGMLPYRRQAWTAGTLFNSTLQTPLSVPRVSDPASPIIYPTVDNGSQEVHVRLLQGLSSAIARKGNPVIAVVTRPLFSADHNLLVPEGSRLTGEVIEARPARFFHRGGKLLFTFHEILSAADQAQKVQGYVESIEANADSHIALDAEGTATIRSPKTRFIFPAIATAAAGLSLHQDYNSQGVPDQDIGGRAESGAVGLGLIGTVLAQAARPLASSIAFMGAGMSIYSTFISRGTDIVLPVNTPVTISVKVHPGGTAPVRKPASR